MKKIPYLFLFLFSTLSLYSQCPENVSGCKTSVYKESPASIDLLTFNFNNQLRLIEVDEDIYDISSDRLVTKDATPYFETDINIGSYDSKKIMCYYHLNNAWNYVAASPYSSVLDNMPLVLEFDPTFNDEMNT
ncbi:MAG: hypothetical protein ACJATI_004350 [Halioglobus sp.]|jgi:hypothetical protein